MDFKLDYIVSHFDCRGQFKQVTFGGGGWWTGYIELKLGCGCEETSTVL